jgi:predicted secreted protein
LKYGFEECPMKKVAYIILAVAFLSIAAASASVCDNAPCEKTINATVGENFAISLPFYSGTGFEWWARFDPAYLDLVNSSEVAMDSGSVMVGVPQERVLTFSAKMAGNTDVIMLLLQPWVNSTIAERKIFPVNIT